MYCKVKVVQENDASACFFWTKTNNMMVKTWDIIVKWVLMHCDPWS